MNEHNDELCHAEVEVRWMILGPAPSFVRPISPGLALPASLRKQVCAFYGSNGYGDRPEMHQALSHVSKEWLLVLACC